MIKRLFRKKKTVDERKTRSDKRLQVAPTVPTVLKEKVECLSTILGAPVKLIGEALCYEGVHIIEVIDLLSPHFVKSVRIENSIFFGNPDKKPMGNYTGRTGRINIRFTQTNYSDIELLADLMDCTPSRATALLIDASIRCSYVVETIVRDYNYKESLSNGDIERLNKLMNWIANDNPYKDFKWGDGMKLIAANAERGILQTRKGPTTLHPDAIDKETYIWHFD